MNDIAAALRPLREADESIRRLDDYDTPAELAAAIRAVEAAVERSLRLRLRGDASAPDEHRLTALSPQDLPLEEVVRSLRSRSLISLELAGTVHELRSAAARAGDGEARASDADVARRAIAHLRRELAGAAQTPERDVETAAGASVRAPHAEDADVPPERRGRWMAWLAAGIAVFFVIMLAWVLARGADSDYERAVGMFRAGRLDSAAVMFRQVLEDRPGHVTSMLYMGRIHRRQGERAEAAAVLRSAAAEAPRDPDVRRELGHLFMDLDQPRSAVVQYERALEQDPEDTRNWVGLIRALRALGDPRAERLLRDAPADVQALLGPTGG